MKAPSALLPASKPVRPWLAPLIVGLLTFFVWISVILNDFVASDDLTLIINNPRFSPPTWDTVVWYWTHIAWNLYMPITTTLWAALAKIGWVQSPDQFGGHLNPYIFHLTSVVMHTATAIALFAILRKAVRNDFAAAAGALLFSVHPVQVEAVAFIGAINNPLFAFLSLAAIWQYLHFTAGARRKHFYIGTVLLILSLLSKPTAVVVPPIAFLLDQAINRRSWRAAAKSILPWFILVFPFVIGTTLIQHNPLVQYVPWHLRPLIAGDTISFYLDKLFWPAHLAFDYSRSPSVVLANPSRYFICWPAVLLIVTGVLVYRSKPLLATAIAIFLIALLPNSGIVSFDAQYMSTVTDRYIYLAMLGPSLAIAVILAKWPTRILPSITALVLATLVVKTEFQIRTWRDSETLFRHIIQVNPNSWVGYVNLGDILGYSSPQEAIEDCRIAIRLRPEFSLPYNNLGSLLMDQGDVIGARQAFAKGHEVDPNNQVIAQSLAKSLQATTQPGH
jgi:tetratricopeptide (TPR) repeat protein